MVINVLKKSLVIILALVFAIMPVAQARALSNEDEKVLKSGIKYFNTQDDSCAPRTSVAFGSTASGGSIFVLGDSLTVGMRDAGGLEGKLAATGWQPTGVVAEEGQSLAWGVRQIRDNAEVLAPATTKSILIGLGTNDYGSAENAIESGMQDLVDEIKEINPDAKLYWTSFFMTSGGGNRPLDVASEKLNETLAKVATKNGIAVIPWSTSEQAKQVITSDGRSDGIHPSDYNVMADFVVAGLSNTGGQAPPPTSSGCSCSSSSLRGSDNQERVFNFFTDRGYTPEQAAGIVGNMMHESGVEPMREQGQPADKQVSSRAVIDGSWSGGPAWGVVQWDPPTKMIRPALDNGVAYETIDTLDFQLEVLYNQLEGTGDRALSAINEKGAGDKLKLTTTAEDAAWTFGRYFERFQFSEQYDSAASVISAWDGGNESEPVERYYVRIVGARDVLSIYGGGAGAVSGFSGGGGGGCTNNGAGPNGWDLPGEGPNPMTYYSQRSDGDDPAVQGYYGQQPYGPGPIAHCGCGPTSWAMIVSSLTGQKVEPPAVAEWAATSGYQQSGSPCGGSLWWWDNPTANASAAFAGAAVTASETKWGVKARQITIEEAAGALQGGALIMVSSNADNTGNLSPFTSGGHLLVMRAFTADGKYLFADPNDYADDRPVAAAAFSGQSKSRVPLAPEQFMPSTQGLWAITKSTAGVQ